MRPKNSSRGNVRDPVVLPVRGLHPFIGESTWAITPLIEAHERLVAQPRGDSDDGVFLIDESGMPTKL